MSQKVGQSDDEDEEVFSGDLRFWQSYLELLESGKANWLMQGDALKEAFPDLGNVNGVPMPKLQIYDGSTVEMMGELELREALLRAQDGWAWAYTKMHFYAHHLKIKPDSIRRDPGAPVIIGHMVQQGKSDQEIADELGEKVRYVESIRLALLKNLPHLKNKRGRPPGKKSPTGTP